MRELLKVSAGLCLMVCMAPAANAGSASADLGVSATVPPACAITVPTPVVFGQYTGSEIKVTGTINANCVSGTPWTIALGPGNGAGATVTNRTMTSGAFSLAYALYKDAAYSQNWGNTGSDTVSGTGTGADQPQTVYARIAAGLSPAPGDYTDTVTATITF